MMFGYKTKPNFTVENERAISTPPKVDFSRPAEKKVGPPADERRRARCAPRVGVCPQTDAQ